MINEEFDKQYCNLEIEFNQETDDGDLIQIELYCQYKKEHNNSKDHFEKRHYDSKRIEHDDETTVLHINWATLKTEELE